MKKILLTFLLSFLFSLLSSFCSPVPSWAQTSINIEDYLAPPPGSAPVKVTLNSGEVFYTVRNGNEFLQCKNEACSSYQKLFIVAGGFGLQGENYWDDGNGTKENYTFQYRLSDGTLAPWLPVTMSVNETYGSPPFNVVGYFIDSNGGVIQNPNCGPNCGPTEGVQILLESIGPAEFAPGVVFADVAKFVIVGGPGAGEVFYFAKGIGWIGWSGNVPNSPAGPAPSGTPRPISPPKTTLTCKVNDAGDQTSRPVPCDACNQGPLTPGCATAFTVNDQIFYQRSQSDFTCEGSPWIEEAWGGMITIDPSSVKIPFVGAKGQENESKYLTDYFEGTNELYKNYSQYWTDWTSYAGVYRKLTPMQNQDQKKTNMVKRAVESKTGQTSLGGIHDYKIKYIGRLCWDSPFAGDAFLAVLTKIGVPLAGEVAKYTHYCVFEGQTPNPGQAKLALDAFNLVSPLDIPYQKTENAEANLSALITHLPPNPNDADYTQKWQDWKKSEWGRLWEMVPQASREDTVGRINPYLGAKAKDKFEFQGFMAKIENVPHLARYYELGQAVQKTLTPNTPVLGETSLLAQAKSFHLEAAATYEEPNVNVSISFVDDSCGEVGHITLYLNGAPLSGPNNWDGHPAPFSWEPQWTGSPFVVQRGQTIPPISWQGSTDAGPCMGQMPSVSCSFSIDLQGKLITNCGVVVTPPAAPVCGLKPATKVDSCQREALTDINPNDNLCCQPIKIKLTAVDQVRNSNYVSCQQDPVGCLENESEAVSRQIGIALAHPYLKQIWDATAGPQKGIFNIFRPAQTPKFRPIDAASTVSYEYEKGQPQPDSGQFYFPYLGGVQLAKDWVVRSLIPKK